MHTSTWDSNNKNILTAFFEVATSPFLEKIGRFDVPKRKPGSKKRLLQEDTATISVSKGELPASETALEENNQSFYSDRLKDRELHKFLIEESKLGGVASETVRLAISLLRSLRSSGVRNIITPNAGIGPDGQILFSWNRGDNHFELEVFPSGEVQAFYLNFPTDESWESAFNASENVPAGVIDCLTLIFD